MAAVLASLTVPKTSYLEGEVVTVSVLNRDASRYYTQGWSVKDAAGVGMGELGLPLPVGQTAISKTPPTAPTLGIYGQMYYTVDLDEWTSQPADSTNYADPKYVGRFSVSVTIYKSGTTVPTITSAGLKEGNPVVTAAAIGGYVQGVSTVSWDIAASSPSGIASYEITIDGVLYRGKSGTSGALLTSGAKSIVTKVTDAAGATQTRTDNITVLAYAPPKVTTFNAFRATSAGAPLETGTNIRMAFTGTVASLVVGTQKNSSSWVIKSRPLGGSYTNNSVGTSALAPAATVTPAGFPVTTAYEVRLELSDKLTTVAAVTYVAKGGIVVDMGPNNIGVGKEWQQGTLDVGGDIYQSGQKVIDASSAATDAAKGIVELATPAEVIAGLDTTRAVTPAGARAAATAGDTAWAPLTLEPGWGSYAGETGYWRIKGGVCYLLGRVTGQPSAGTTIAVLPAVARPTSFPMSVVWTTHSDNGPTITLVGASGDVVIASRIGLLRQGVSLAGMSFPVG